MARRDCGTEAAGQPDDREMHPPAGSPARSRLCLRAAEARAARLHGAEGRRDGCVLTAAGADPLHAGLKGQWRADARQCHRGCRAVRHSESCLVADPVPLERFLDGRDPQRLLVFCDEAADVADPLEALRTRTAHPQGVDVLIGPEGGFAEEERALLLRQKQTLKLALGPRILRADTAGVAALALVQAALGDWRGPGR